MGKRLPGGVYLVTAWPPSPQNANVIPARNPSVELSGTAGKINLVWLSLAHVD